MRNMQNCDSQYKFGWENSFKINQINDGRVSKTNGSMRLSLTSSNQTTANEVRPICCIR